MVKLVIAVASWGLCILGAVMVQWVPQFSGLSIVTFLSVGMLGWAVERVKKGDIDPKKAPTIFKLLSVPSVIGGILLTLFGFYVMLNWNGTGELIDGVYYLVHRGTVMREITREEYLFLLRSESWLFLGYGIAGGAKAAELWAADYWWYGPSIFNTRVREFFKFHK